MLDCKECKTRHRADNLIQEYDPSVNADAMTQEEMVAFIREKQIPCPVCKKSNFTGISSFQSISWLPVKNQEASEKDIDEALL